MIYKFTLLLGLLLFTGLTPLFADDPPVMSGNETSSPQYSTETSTPVALFPDFTITDTENDNIKGLVIAFTSGNHTDQDVLSFTNQNGITGTFDKSKGALVLTGDASPANYQAAVRSITYTNDAEFSSVNNEQRTLTISLANTDYFSQDSKLDDGHFYKYVSTELSWTDAKTAAASTTYYGLQGYLCTVTSAAENSFILGIQDNADGVLWLGGSDDVSQGTSEGIWKWVTGPEAGTTFYQGGTAYNGSYVNWGPSQPSNDGNVENYLQFFTNRNSSTLPPGKWNDRKNTTATGYIIEYGGMSGDPTINMTTTTTLNIDVVPPKAPGGIVDNLRVWFNANSGTTNEGSSVTNGNITSWEGQKPYGVNTTIVNDVAGDPSVVPNSANFNSVVSFDGDDAIRTSSRAPYTTYFNSTTDNNTVFLVKKTTGGLVEAGYGYEDEDIENRAGYFERAGVYQRTDYGKPATELVGGGPTTIDDKYIIARQDVQPDDLSLYLNGILDQQASSFGSLSGSYDGYLGFGSNPYSLTTALSTTDIAEYIIYAADLSETEVKEVESYLALKYGISKTDDYLASDGSTIWSATDNTGYTTDIFGIGQDNASGLNQKVSRSVNNANGPILATIQNFTASNTDGSRTELGNGNFMLMGHNNGTENSFTAGFNSGTNNRSDRVWKVDETGTVGEVYFAIPKTAIMFPPGIPVLVISNDLTFDSSDDVVNLTDDGTYYWASINPNDEAYLAFATTTPGFTLSKSALTIGENAGTGTFTVVLDAQPLNDVVFKVTSDDTNEATVDESTLTFTTANWNTPQTVTVTGVNDNIDRNDNATITVSVDDASSDDIFDALDDQTVAVTLTNDDTAGFTVSETNLTIPENAGTGTFTVVLNTEPTTDVVLDVVCDKTAEATVSAPSLTFTSENWDTPQTVTVTGVDDDIDRDDNATITVSVDDASSDDTFDALDDQTVAVTLTNDDQTITFNELADKTYGDADFNLTGTASSGLTVTYTSSDTDVATVSGNTVTILGAGTTTITASQAGNDDYNAASDVEQKLTVGKADQTITFTTLDNKTYGDADFNLTGTASSGLTVTYTSSNTDVATVSDSTVTILGAGTTTITASQAGNDDYNAASDVEQVLTVGKADQTITFTTLDNKTYGDADFNLTGTASSGLTVTYTSSNTDVATVSDSTVTILGAGTTTITASQAGDDDYNAASNVQHVLTVGKADQTITFSALDDKTYGDADFNLTGTASSGLTVTYTSSNTDVATVSDSTVTILGAGTTTITASQAGDDDYNAASNVQHVLTVGKADQTITFSALDDKTYGDADFNLTGTASSGLTVTYTSSNTDVATVSDNTVTILGAGTTTITASQAGDDDYNAASNVQHVLTVGKADQTITFTALDDKTYGDANFDLTGTASSELTVSYASSNTDVATVSGNKVTIVGAGTTTITASQSGNDNYKAASDVQQELTVNAVNQTITFTALDDKTYGDADFNLTGTASSGLTVTYTSSNTNVATVSGNKVTIVGAGIATITASQAGDDNYSVASNVQQELKVRKKVLTVTAADKLKTYGEDNPELTFTYSGFVTGDNESDLTTVPVASTEATAASVAGNYKITVGGGVDENYAFTYNDATLTIEKARLTVTATADDKVYDGTTTASITLSDDRVSGDMLTINTTSAEFEDKNVGEGKAVTVSGIILSGPDANNYQLASTTASATADITKKDLTVNNAVAHNKVYDGTTDAVTSGAVLKGVVSNDNVELENESVGIFAQSTVGNDIEVTTLMTINGADAANYSLVQPTGLKADITEKELIITGTFTVSDKEYEGATDATIATNNLYLSGILGEDEVTLTNVVAAFETASAGNGLTVNIVSADLTGDDADQYSLSLENSPTATASIWKKTATVTGASGITKTYDGNKLLPSEMVAYEELNGILSEDETQVELTGNPLFDLADAGDRVIVQGNLKLTGPKADNYSLVWTDGTGKIEKATLIVEANNDAKFVTQDDENNYAGVSISGYVNGENNSAIDQTGLTIIRNNATENIAGEYTDVLEASGLLADNYVFTYLSGDYSIIPAHELLVEINDTSIVYSEVSTYGISSARYLDSDGNTIKELTENITALNNNQFSIDDGVGSTVNFSINEINPEYNSLSNRLAVGSYQLEATEVSGSSTNFNNTIHVTGALTVTTKEVEVQIVSGSERKAFDGDANMDNLDMFTSDLVAGDDVELSGNGSFSQSEAGTDIAYSVTFALQGADKDNYHLKTDVPITGNDGKIAQIELIVIEAKASNKVYDGTTTATITGATLNGAITGDDVALANENTGAFVTDAVGNDIEVLTSMTLAGADKDNYVLIQPTGLKANIEPQELTVTNAAAKNKVYDGTTDATIVDATLSGVVADDEVLLENAESGTFKQDIVGTEIEVATAMTISGADASNYYLIQPIGITADITTRELTVKDAVAENKVYDGTVNAVVSGAVLDGYISGDDVILANHTVGTFIQSSVGENIQVVTLMTLEGDDKDNYTLKQPSYLTANITAAELTLSGSFVVNNKEYDGTAIATMLENNLQFNGLASGDIVSLDSIMLAFETSNAGTGLEVYITEAKISGSDASKYSFSLNGAPVTSASINKKELTVTADNKTKEYDGSGYSSFTVSYNGFIDGEDETNLSGALSFTGTATTAINAGTDYTITPGGLSSENYAIIYVDGYLDIQKVDQTITFNPISQQILSNSSFELSAVASSGLTVEYSSSDESIATVSGKIVTFINSGTCTIYANQLGNVNYNTAEQVLQTLTIIPYISGDSNHDGKITPPEIAGDSNEDGQINDGEVAGDTNGNGQIDDDEVAGDNNGDGKISEPEVAGDTDGNGQIDDDEVAGDNNGDGKITEPEVAGDTDGNGQIDDDEVAGDTNGDGKITDPEVAGDTNSDGQIGNGEIAGDTDGDGQITEPEVAGDTNGDGQINDDEVAGDTNGDGTITAPEVSGDTNGDGQIGDGEVAGDIDGDGTITALEIAGDTNGDGQVTSPEIIGDTDGNGIINDDEVTGDRNGDGNIGSGETAGESETEGSNIAGDTNGDGKITDTEVAGDTNGDGQIGNGEIAGDTDGDGQITDPEVAGDTDGNGQIDDDEVAGDTNGDGKITDPEVAGDTDGNGQINDDERIGDVNGDGQITDPEVAGDTDGNGQINDNEVAGDTNGDGKITDPEVAGDTDGNGQINDDERIGDVNGDGQITAPEIAGDADGNGVINNSETAEGAIANISILSIEENTYENPDSEIYYLIDCEDESNQVAVTFTPDAYATSPHVREFNIEIPGPGLYNEEINVVSEDGINTRTYRIVVEKRFNYNDIVIQKYNNVLLINNNPATNGGYRFTAFNWYKDGGLIGTGQYYSVGDNVSDQLDLNAKYSVEIETEDGDVLRTCDFTVSYSNIFSLKVAPNPVRSGSTIDVTTTYSTEMLSDLKISVSNLYGVEVMQEMSGSNNSRITLPSSLTPGTYVVSTKAGGVELSAKIIVQ